MHYMESFKSFVNIVLLSNIVYTTRKYMINSSNIFNVVYNTLNNLLLPWDRISRE